MRKLSSRVVARKVRTVSTMSCPLDGMCAKRGPSWVPPPAGRSNGLALDYWHDCYNYYAY